MDLVAALMVAMTIGAGLGWWVRGWQAREELEEWWAEWVEDVSRLRDGGER